jgi:hypothetical protein
MPIVHIGPIVQLGVANSRVIKASVTLATDINLQKQVAVIKVEAAQPAHAPQQSAPGL